MEFKTADVVAPALIAKIVFKAAALELATILEELLMAATLDDTAALELTLLDATGAEELVITGIEELAITELLATGALDD
jgi:hypothetical protein